MEFIAHRGLWDQLIPKNSEEAFQKCFQNNWGTETDLRDCMGNLVVSHDPPTNSTILSAEQFFKKYTLHKQRSTLALNIKADGLQKMLTKALEASPVENYFVFDMSIPDSLHWIRGGHPWFSRQSEYEPLPALYDKASGVWLDMFTGQWFDTGTILDHLNAKKSVCIVSPELHGRDPRPFWEWLRKEKFVDEQKIILCTDQPKLAKEAING